MADSPVARAAARSASHSVNDRPLSGDSVANVDDRFGSAATGRAEDQQTFDWPSSSVGVGSRLLGFLNLAWPHWTSRTSAVPWYRSAVGDRPRA